MTLNVNLGCGPVFVESHEWLNFDYQPSHRSVRQADLLQALPLLDDSCDLVYSSHFLEHIPREMVPGFLHECFRILRPGGIIRLVLPDFEELCKEYLHQRQKGDNEKADFVVVEIIDQCVRMKPGGELGRLYQKYSNDPASHSSQIKYLRERNGEDLGFDSAEDEADSFSEPSSIVVASDQTPKAAWRRVFKPVNHILMRLKPSRLLQSLRNRYFWWLLARLPVAFRMHNVSLSAVGERHHWLWDFHQLQSLLISTGFIEPLRQAPNTSRLKDFAFFPLDIDKNGCPRKGKESMYVEARKPC